MQVWRQVYDNVAVDEPSVYYLREAQKMGTVILLPTHRSYVDFLLLSYVCFHYNFPLPHIAAGTSALLLFFVRVIASCRFSCWGMFVVSLVLGSNGLNMLVRVRLREDSARDVDSAALWRLLPQGTLHTRFSA